MFTKSKLLQARNIVHGFFGCKDGTSKFKSKSTDYATACSKLGLMVGQLNTVRQIHSDKVHIPDGNDSIEADALATNKPGMALGIQTADCAPILLVDHHHKVIGAAHAGWRGALSGVIENTVDAMLSLGAVASNIVAVIGPTIQQVSYEVDSTFYQTFSQQHGRQAEQYFIPSANEGRYMFDLPTYCVLRLKSSGVTTIDNLAIDTYTDPKTFFSFRRSTHEGKSDYGNQISIIALI